MTFNSDFGLSRSGDEYILSADSKVPVKWTAIEVLMDQPATTASDIWSFGVVCWEVFENGTQPFVWYSNQETVENLKGKDLDIFEEYP